MSKMRNEKGKMRNERWKDKKSINPLISQSLNLLILFHLLFFISPISAQPVPEKTRLLIIQDCSNSMWDHWQSASKIKVTQQVLLSFIDSVSRQQDVDVALRVFGHVNKEQFTTRLEVPFGADNYYRLQSKIKTLVPQGDCVAGEALTDALSDFPHTASSRNIILIITDGMDDCEAEICDVARQVQLSGVVVQTFVLGIGGGSFNHASCAGTVFTVPREEQFASTLHDIFRLSGRKASVLLRLLDASGELYETEHPVVFSDSRTGVARLNTIYSIDFRLRPDTLLLDPLVTYDMTLFTRPELHREGLQFDADKSRNTLDLNVIEGSLRVRYSGPRPSWQQANAVVTVRPQSSPQSAYRQDIGELVGYLAGLYDVEVQTTPPTIMRGVEVRGGAATELSVPMPGMLQLAKPKEITSGAIFRRGDGKMERVADLNPNTASERMQLQPGEYEVVLHPQQSTSYRYVETRRFVIASGQTTKLAF